MIKRARSSPVFWPAVGLLALLILNAGFNPSFLKITVLDGHLFGTPVDILLHGARPMLLALGMTLVIATGGVDLSVGSVVAIAGAACALLLQGGHSLGVTLAVAVAAETIITVIITTNRCSVSQARAGRIRQPPPATRCV